jgi:hypothetical protein
LTSLTVDEFQQVVLPFEAAYQRHTAPWRLDGKPRTARRYTTYQNCPLPTPEDRLLFILVYLKTYPSGVAPQLTVVMSTTAQPGVARLVKGAHAAWVVSSERAERETTTVPEHSSNDR